jgi:hypothetical protein
MARYLSQKELFQHLLAFTEEKQEKYLRPSLSTEI